jgi:hypothetical protein
MNDQQGGNQSPQPQPKTETPATPKSGRYGAFDKTLSRYVGGVRDTKAEAETIAKGIRDAGRKAEVREV